MGMPSQYWLRANIGSAVDIYEQVTTDYIDSQSGRKEARMLQRQHEIAQKEQSTGTEQAHIILGYFHILQ